MNNVYDTANRLAYEIKESKEYKDYKLARQKINENPELKEKIDEFEKVRYEAQVLSIKAREEDKEKIQKLQELYDILVKNSDIKEYFDLEVKFNVMIADINKIIAESIKDVLKNNITAFSGNSGVGKSTLINGIFKDKIAEEGTISNKNKKGKNTTTTVELYKIDNNSYIADTPGFATFDIYEIKSGELDEYFREFHNYIEECEYIGCNHIKEINCGVKKAVEYEEISKMRYQNYCKIYNELKQKEDNRW